MRTLYTLCHECKLVETHLNPVTSFVGKVCGFWTQFFTPFNPLLYHSVFSCQVCQVCAVFANNLFEIVLHSVPQCHPFKFMPYFFYILVQKITVITNVYTLTVSWWGDDKEKTYCTILETIGTQIKLSFYRNHCKITQQSLIFRGYPFLFCLFV